MKIQDWAEQLVAKKIARGDSHVTPSQLRKEVAYYCVSNSRREGMTREERKAEWHRLVALRQEEDAREELEHQYGQEGYEVEASRQPGKVYAVKLPFTGEEWADLLNADGEHLPACCAPVSEIRNVLQEACRNDHMIKMYDLANVIIAAKQHGFENNRLVQKLFDLWTKFEPVADDTSLDLESGNLSDPKEALDMLAEAANNISWHQLASKGTKEAAFQCLVQCNSALATVRTAVHTLYHHMTLLEKEPVEGYGVVAANGEIAYGNTGICVFRDRELAEKVASQFSRQRKSTKKPKRFGVKIVRVSMRRGVEILPDDHPVREPVAVAQVQEKKSPDEID